MPEKIEDKEKLKVKTLTVRLTNADYKAFRIWCHHQYTTMAEQVYNLIQKHMDENNIREEVQKHERSE